MIRAFFVPKMNIGVLTYIPNAVTARQSGKTWLILRSEAERMWGHRVKYFVVYDHFSDSVNVYGAEWEGPNSWQIVASRHVTRDEAIKAANAKSCFDIKEDQLPLIVNIYC